MDILEDLTFCQNLIHREYSSVDRTSLNSLNEFCAEFLKCCNKLHKILISECQGKYELIEIIFLCLNQITCCTKYLEKTIKYERSTNTVLFLSKQYFSDRMLWCFARMKSLLSSIKDDVFFTTKMEETNFIDMLDEALEYLSPYTYHEFNNLSNRTNLKNEALYNSQKLRISIDKVISQSLAFANVTELDEKKIINALCQNILRNCMEFEEECKIIDTDKNHIGNYKNIHLKASIVENALYKLEDFINESVLKLIMRVFTDFNQNCIQNIRKAIVNNPNDERIDNMIADFDINVDRLIQIGLFAVAFSPNTQEKTIVQNCLASLESLDSYLIPSLYGKCNLHSTILEEHFIEEIEKLKKSIQKIIETNALFECFLFILNKNINNKVFNLKVMEDNIQMANLLLEHIELNQLELKLNEKHDEYKIYQNFKLMVNECQAALNCANQIDSERVLKRFKIMKSLLKKLTTSLYGCKKKKEKENVFITSDDLAESQKLFESVGISPTTKKVLYQNKKDDKNLTDSLITQCSKKLNFYSSLEKFSKDSPERKSIKRRVSLRTAMFKRQQNEETHKIHKIYTENSMNLELTDILDQLTGLSSSFGNLTLSN